MGTIANIPATVTESSVLVIGIRYCSSSIAHHGWLAINQLSPCFMSRTLILYTRLLSAWERGSSLLVWQCSSRDHEAIDVDRKCCSWYPFIHITWKTDNFFILLFDVIWLAPSWLSYFNRLGDLKQKSVPDSSDNQTSKALCPPEGHVRKGRKITEVHDLLLRQQANMNNYQNCRWSNNFSTAPTSSLLQANFVLTFVCYQAKKYLTAKLWDKHKSSSKLAIR